VGGAQAAAHGCTVVVSDRYGGVRHDGGLDVARSLQSSARVVGTEQPA
jgi:hypothetical protein